MTLLLIRFHLRSLVLPSVMALVISVNLAAEEAPAPAVDAAKNAKLEEALKKLKLPGVEINLKERCVDVASTVCLREGPLELIACTKDTKEHESIIRIEAVPKHVHTALLLIGARPGSPAMRKLVNEQAAQWIDVQPSGGAVDVSLVFPGKEGELVEHPISDFIVANDHEAVEGAKQERFPSSTFMFAGSELVGEKDGPRQYLADSSGNVISLATFGDELLCLPGLHDADNGSLMWRIDGTHLPEVGAKVTLRLRPLFKAKPAAGSDKPSAPVAE